MIRSSFSLLKHAVKSSIVRSNTVTPASFRSNTVSPRKYNFIESNNRFCSRFFSGSTDSGAGGGGSGDGELGLGLGLGKGDKGNDDCDDSITYSEAKKLMRLVNVEALKMRLSGEGTETVCYSKVLEVCQSIGVTKSVQEAKEFVRVLDEAGVVLVFRDKVYLHPDKWRDRLVGSPRDMKAGVLAEEAIREVSRCNPSVAQDVKPSIEATNSPGIRKRSEVQDV